MKRSAFVFAAALFLALARVAFAAEGPAPASPWSDPAVQTRVEPALLKQLLAAGPGDRIPMIVVMAGRTATGPELMAQPELVASMRGEAAIAQAGVRSFLADEEGAGRAEDVRSFWIFNGLALRAAATTAEALARRSDVALLRLDRLRQYVAPGETPVLESAGGDTAARPSGGPAWGVKQVRADMVWSALDDTGSGVVVANLDTGVDFQHPALTTNYRGNAGKNIFMHAGSWFDATGEGAVYPVDGNGHGTHTMGTMAGQDGIGVAPGARWIAVRVLNSAGYGYDSWIHAGFQWLLAPNGDPALAPQVVSNSWVNSAAESTEFENDLELLRRAGMVVVFSAGNTGPGPATVGSPASLPGAFAVGASDSDDEVASFSSRGPSPWDQVKPQVVAPGVNVPSSVPGGSYASLSGTSMAAPHVAGVAALMLSINPSLTVTGTETLLTSTAVSRGGTVPNNNSGWGRVDAYAAVQAAAGAGVLEGTVVDGGSRLPLADALVTVERLNPPGHASVETDAAGRYRTGLAAGAYRITASHFAYQPDTRGPVTVITGTTTTSDLVLTAMPTGVLLGDLTDDPISQPATATISVLNTPVAKAAYGQYALTLPEGEYTVQARGLGYRVMTGTVTITAGQTSRHDFRLPKAPRVLFVDSGAWYYGGQPGYFREALDSLSYAYDERRIKHLPADIPTLDDLRPYNLVVWSAPQDSPELVNATYAITRYLKAGGRMIVTGQDVAFWDGGGSGLPTSSYLRDYFKTNFIADDAGTRTVAGVPGDIMDGLDLDIAGGTGANNQANPDMLAVASMDHAAEILRYPAAGTAGTRAGLCLPYRTVLLGFGLEGISTATGRSEVLRRAIDYLFSPPRATGFSLDRTGPGIKVGPPGSVVTFTLRVRNTAEVGSAATYEAGVDGGTWETDISSRSLTLAPCASAALKVTARIPAAAGVDATNVLTVTLMPAGRPDAATVMTLTAKAPAPVLVVDHHRWYDVQGAYTGALDATGIGYDVWSLPVDGAATGRSGPPASQMKWYPLVLWFTGYDWFQPLTADDETQLSSFLDGGGRLLLSSAFYLDQRGDSSFARERLGVLDFTRGYTATQTFGALGYGLGAGLGRIDLFNPYPHAGFYTLDGAVVPASSAHMAWRGDTNRGQAIAKDEAGERLVFWTIPLEAMAGDMRARVLQRTLGWLGPLGRSAVAVEPPVLAAGQAATVTVTLQDDLVAGPASMTVNLPPGTAPDESTLPPEFVYDPAANRLRFSGEVSPSVPLTFTFRLNVGAGPGRLAGSVLFRDERLGLDYDQPLELAVATPDLRTSLLSAAAVRGARPANVTLALRNTGLAPAAGASAVVVMPLGAVVLPGSVTVDGPGSALGIKETLEWTGSLNPGEVATVTFEVLPPSWRTLQVLPMEMLAWDGMNGAWEQRAWLTVQPYTLMFPWVARQ